jgi:hypothetical protein
MLLEGIKRIRVKNVKGGTCKKVPGRKMRSK